MGKNEEFVEFPEKIPWKIRKFLEEKNFLEKFLKFWKKPPKNWKKCRKNLEKNEEFLEFLAKIPGERKFPGK